MDTSISRLLHKTQLGDENRNTAFTITAVHAPSWGYPFRGAGESSLRGSWTWVYIQRANLRVRSMRSLQKVVACLCLLLTCWSAIALVAHHHSNGIDAAKCSVCIAAHSATPKAATNLKSATFSFVGVYRPKPVSSKQFLLAFALAVRPPPQA
jgi:hypothetical protein